MQRNAAFRNAYFSGREAHVDAWDMQIASGAAYLVRKRVESLRQMNRYAEKCRICFPITEKNWFFVMNSLMEKKL